MILAAFLPTTLAGWSAVAAALGATIAGLLSLLNRHSLTEVKISVNGKLDAALTEIDSLKKALITARAAPAEKPPKIR
jgi:hypothetical protein